MSLLRGYEIGLAAGSPCFPGSPSIKPRLETRGPTRERERANSSANMFWGPPSEVEEVGLVVAAAFSGQPLHTSSVHIIISRFTVTAIACVRGPHAPPNPTVRAPAGLEFAAWVGRKGPGRPRGGRGGATIAGAPPNRASCGDSPYVRSHMATAAGVFGGRTHARGASARAHRRHRALNPRPLGRCCKASEWRRRTGLAKTGIRVSRERSLAGLGIAVVTCSVNASSVHTERKGRERRPAKK